MPYTKDNPPEAIKRLPAHAQEIFIAAYNSAYEQYKGDEAKINAIAWAAVKQKYEKVGDEWKAKESYNDIVFEATQRLFSKDISNILGGKATIEEQEECLKWLREQEFARTEDGVKFPAEAYAYVPDKEKPSTWKLRIWEDPAKKVTRKQLGAAAAALSPGGFRGQKADIPSGELSKVKAKIRAAYRSLDIEDMPRWVKEATVRDFVKESCAIELEEVTAEKIAQGVIPVRFLVPGFNASKERYYTPEAIKDAVKVFENVKMYADHPTDEDDKNRPERSIKDWAATLKNCRVSPQGNAIGEAYINAGWLKEKAQMLHGQGLLEQLAVSILGVGKGVKGEIDGVKTNIIEGIVKGRSVDFVTEPGAGGRAGIAESADESTDVDVVTMETLKKERPDLIEMLTIELSETIKPKQEVKMTEEIKELQEKLATTENALKEANDKLTAEQSARAKADAKALIDKAIAEAELPAVSKERIAKQFADRENTDGLADAIKAEQDYVLKVNEAGRVKDMGATKEDPAKAFNSLVESFERAGMSHDQAVIAAKGR